MRVALLAANGLEAAMLEEFLASHPEAGVEVVWTVTAPGSVLAALDHDPHLYLLDMRWGRDALDAARLLQQFGLPLIICLFDRMDDPLLTEARALNLEAFHWGSPRALLGWLRGVS
jgi:DNA-binding NarL/FixJ family response regulator